MNRFSKLFGTLGCVTLLAGCATYNGDVDAGGYYAAPRYAANYDNSCDYYTPPWGYPADYCRYQTWNDPVYYGGAWYSGPIYYRNYAGANWFWLNGDWRRDEWRGPRPNIDWNRGGNRYWQGEVRRAGNNFDGRRDLGERRDFDGRNGDNNGRFGGGPGPGRGNADRANYGPPPGGPGPRNNAVNNPAPGNQNGGRFDGRGPGNGNGNAERANNPAPPDGGRGPRNNAVSAPPPANARNVAQPAAMRNSDTGANPPPRAQGQGLVGGLARGRAAATRNDNSSDDNNGTQGR